MTSICRDSKSDSEVETFEDFVAALFEGQVGAIFGKPLAQTVPDFEAALVLAAA